MPDSSSGVGDFDTHEPDAVIARIGFELAHCRASPRHDSRLLSHGRAYTSKTKRLIDPGYTVLSIRGIIVHVTLARMTLAPGVLVWDDVLGFSKIGRFRV